MATAIDLENGEKPQSGGRRKELEIDKLFRALVKLEGSDLHMKVGLPQSGFCPPGGAPLWQSVYRS
jgi:hypothetical protein